MIAALIFSLALSSSASPVVHPAFARTAPDDPDLTGKIAAAGTDVAKLLELAASCSSEDAAKLVYKRVVEVDPNNETARKALRHQLYDGKWFESFTELSKYKRDEDTRMKAKGLARHKDEWVPLADIAFLNMGWVRDADQTFVHPAELARRKQIEEWKAAGYQFRPDDNSWIAPTDNEQWAALQWKCGDMWLDMAKADEYHSKLDQSWEVAGEHFVTWTTCDWAGANIARWHADRIQPDMIRLFGIAPKAKPHFVVLNSLDEYNKAAGNGTLAESEGFSSLHGAFFADAYFDGSTPPEYMGCGVSYWDRKDPKLAVWGPYWVRWAAAQSYIDAIDPSWSAIGERVASGAGVDNAAFGPRFWADKRIPRWLRYGAAAYAERFLKDPEAAEGADPWALRTFAFGELKKNGGLRKLDDVFAFRLSLADLPGSTRLYDESGLIVSFLLDGAANNKDLAQKHEAFRAALKSGSAEEVKAAAAALQKSLVKSESDIRKYAGL